MAYTDTHGNEFKNFGLAAVKRILDNPTNVTQWAKNDYALVFAEDEQMAIVRNDEGFHVYNIEGDIDKTYPLDKMQDAAKFFVKQVKNKKKGL